MSSRRFSEVFRTVCGRPPMDYVIDVRLDRAAELLREGRLTVSQVADRTGFATVHYFSRVFSRRRGRFVGLFYLDDVGDEHGVMGGQGPA